MEKIRFHLDEQVDRAIGEALSRRGIDVTTTPEAGLLGAVDQEQLAFAISQQRVIFTRDDDFFTHIPQMGAKFSTPSKKGKSISIFW